MITDGDTGYIGHVLHTFQSMLASNCCYFTSQSGLLGFPLLKLNLKKKDNTYHVYEYLLCIRIHTLTLMYCKFVHHSVLLAIFKRVENREGLIPLPPTFHQLTNMECLSNEFGNKCILICNTVYVLGKSLGRIRT